MIARTATQTIYYLLRKLGPTDKLKIVKLVYLADKYHLLHYARTITGDRYYAMEHGPVGSMVKDVFAPNELSMGKADSEYARRLLHHDVGHRYRSGEENVDLDMLSATDIEALDFTAAKFGRMSTRDLRDYTHRYPEWDQYREQFEHDLTSRETIRTTEMLSVIDDNVFGVDEAHRELARAVLNCECDE